MVNEKHMLIFTAVINIAALVAIAYMAVNLEGWWKLLALLPTDAIKVAYTRRGGEE